MRKLAFLFVCVAMFAVAAHAQDARGPEAYFGYSHFTSDKNGWNGMIGYHIDRNFDVDADFGGYYSHENSIHSFMFGPKFQATRRRRGFQPWGHILLGGSHVSNLSGASDTAFSWAVGGGLDSKTRNGLGLRLTADAFHTHFYDNGDWHLRIGAGVFYRF